MIECRICGKKLKMISHAHLRTHNMTTKEYKEKFNLKTVISEELFEKFSKAQKGKKMGDDNPARRKEVREKISNSVKQLWDEGIYSERINGMLGMIGEKSLNWKEENHTPLYLAENKYVDFLKGFQNCSVCSLCGRTDRKINIHHIDENRKNFLPSNLEPLCVPCHVLYHYGHAKRQFVKVSKRFSCAVAHFLPNYDGVCSNLHGHEAIIDVVIRKRILKSTGMATDFSTIKKIVNNCVISKLDHSYLNDIIKNPTAENLSIWIWEQLMFNGLLKGIHSISVHESPNNIVILDADDMLSIFSDNIEDYMVKYVKEEDNETCPEI
jgi:6-pyruvoyltetrahydropterin/6-carboxytetrahydropterin synthase